MPQTSFQIGTMTLSMVLTGLILYYLKNLETIGCKCAMNYKRTYIMSYHIFSLAFGAASLLSGNRLAEYIVESRYAIPFVSVLVIAIITNVVFTLMYIQELEKDNCECSESVLRTMMYILSLISAATWSLLLLFALIAASIFMKSKNLLSLATFLSAILLAITIILVDPRGVNKLIFPTLQISKDKQ